MTELKRLSTGYLENEDRIRLVGETADGAAVVLWLTQHLLLRLVPVLIEGIEAQGADASHREILHGFAQQSARAALKAEPPVQPAHDSQAWLVQSIDVAKIEKTLRLTFKGEGGQQGFVTLEPRLLRQWLGIVYETCRNANWPLAVWPEWLQDSTTPVKQPAILH